MTAIDPKRSFAHPPRLMVKRPPPFRRSLETSGVIYVGLLLLAACDFDSSEADEILVFAEGALQCQPPTTPESSAQILIDAGIDVLWSSCGTKTGVTVPAVCDSPGLDILVHEIRTVNLQDAERLGFQQASLLVDASAGTGYQLTNC